MASSIDGAGAHRFIAVRIFPPKNQKIQVPFAHNSSVLCLLTLTQTLDILLLFRHMGRTRSDEYKAEQKARAKVRRAQQKTKVVMGRRRQAGYQRSYIDRLKVPVSPSLLSTPTSHTRAPITHVVPNTAPPQMETSTVMMTPSQQYKVAASGHLTDMRKTTSGNITSLSKDIARLGELLLENANQGAKDVMEVVSSGGGKR